MDMMASFVSRPRATPGLPRHHGKRARLAEMPAPYGLDALGYRQAERLLGILAHTPRHQSTACGIASWLPNRRIGKKSVIGASVGTYSARGCLPPKCRVDASMNDSDEYRRRAGECLLFTQYVTSERSKQLLVQMALGWRDLAERAELQKRGSEDSSRGDPTPATTEKT
jgi:hypothetical protein